MLDQQFPAGDIECFGHVTGNKGTLVITSFPEANFVHGNGYNQVETEIALDSHFAGEPEAQGTGNLAALPVFQVVNDRSPSLIVQGNSKQSLQGTSPLKT